MTVLFVTHYSGFYGANKSLFALLVLLREKYGVRPIVLLPSIGEMCQHLDEAEIRYYVTHYYWWVNYNHGVFQWLLNKRKQLINMMRIKMICRMLSDENISLVYTNSVCVNVGYALAERLRLPHMWQARESLSQFSLSLSLTLSRKLMASPINKRYILISDYMMRDYEFLMPHDRMVRIYNGVTLPDGVRREKENTISERLQVVCMGVVGSQKNQLELLRAQSLLQQRGIEIDTWLVGTSGNAEYLQQLENYICENNLERRAHLLGHQSNVFDILQRMNLGVVCAHDEAFGRVTVEYMLMQMPVIVSRSGANAELIEAGKTGEVYELGNAEQLADYIEQYVVHSDLLKSHGLAAEKKALSEFSAERNAELIYEQITKAIK